MDELTGAILEKIVYRADRIIRYVTEHTQETFLADEMVQDAVCMNLLNIGELVKQLPIDIRTQYPLVPWRKLAGLRDITAHRYDSLRMVDIWTAANKEVSALKTQVEEILEQREMK
ncbi:nucleotidyltransferase [Clostridia bacterium]|nr:nucleotidyltransferase [Clostridia bacterium]